MPLHSLLRLVRRRRYARTDRLPRKWLAASSTFAVASTITLLTWEITDGEVYRNAEAEFEARATEVLDTVRLRTDFHERLLRGAAGMVSVNPRLDPAQWRDYVAGLRGGVDRAERDGLIATGYARAVPGGRPVVNLVDRDDAPPGFRAGSALPKDAAHGAAIDAVRASGKAAFALHRPEAGPAGSAVLTLYVPVRAADGAGAAAAGYAFAAFDAREYFDAAVRRHGGELGLVVSDVATGSPAVFYDNRAPAPVLPASPPPAFVHRHKTDLRGQSWLLEFHSRPRAEAVRDRDLPRMIMVGGTLLSLILAGLAWTVTDRRSRALRIAGSMTGALRRSEAELRRAKEFAETALHSIADAVIATDHDGVVVHFNPAAAQLTGVAREAAMGRRLASVLALTDEAGAAPLVIGTDRPWQPLPPGPDHARIAFADGSTRTLEFSCAPIRTAEDGDSGAVIVFRDVTAQREEALRVAHHAAHDALTGLPNRREFERIAARLLRSAREAGHCHALLYIDLDRFKPVNDQCGHDAGDQLLREISAIMKSRLRAADTLARLGGDEFGALLSNCDPGHAERAAQGIIDALADYRFRWNGRTFGIGASIGLAAITTGTADIASAQAAADAACFRAKRAGRGRVVTATADAQSTTAAPQPATDWAARLHAAMAQGTLVLVRQRVMSLVDRPSRPMQELLLRLCDDPGTPLLPHAFLPDAERAGLGPEIDCWVLERALDCRPGTGDRPDLAINVTSATVAAGTFPGFLARALADSGVPAGALCFEIAESAAGANPEASAAFTQAIRALGCRVTLEDFTASSWSLVRTLALDHVKVDASLVRAMASDEFARSLVESIVRVAASRGIATMAEGVETGETLATALELGFRHAQGNYVARPEPIDAADGARYADAA